LPLSGADGGVAELVDATGGISAHEKVVGTKQSKIKFRKAGEVVGSECAGSNPAPVTLNKLEVMLMKILVA